TPLAFVTPVGMTVTGNVANLYALAFAADQDIGHAVSRVTGFGNGGIGAVPAGMVLVVSGGASFAMAALPTGAAVQDDFVRAGRPVLVDEELSRFGAGAGGLADQTDFGSDSLQL